MKKIYLGLILFFAVNLSFGQKTFTAPSSTAWGSSANWTPSGVPTITDDVIIPAGKTVNTGSGTKNCKSLTLEFTAAYNDTTYEEIFDEFGDPTGEYDTIINPIPASYSTLTINGSTSPVLNVANNLTLNGNLNIVNGILNVSGNVSAVSAGTISISTGKTMNVTGSLSLTDFSTFTTDGVLNIDGNFDLNSKSISFGSNSITSVAGSVLNGTALIPTSGTFIYDGSSPQTIVTTNYNNLTFSGSGKKTVIGSVSVAGTFVPGTAEVEYNSDLTIIYVLPGDYTTLTYSGNGEKQIFGSVTCSGTFTPGTGKVTYNGGDQTVLAGSYSNIALDNSGTKTILGTVTATTFSISSGVSVTYNSASDLNVLTATYPANLTFSGGGKKTITGNVTVGGTFTLGTGEVVYNSASTLTILPGAYNTLTFTGGGEKQIAGTVTATTFNIGTGKVTYSGTSQTILPAAYNNLALDGSGTHVISGAVSANIFSNFGSSVEYNGGSQQNVIPGTYASNLTFSGSGLKVFTGVTTIIGTFNPNSVDVSYNSSSDVIVKSGAYGALTLEGSGVKTIPDGVTFTSSSLVGSQSVTYSGTDQDILAGAYNALTFSASGTKTIAGIVSASSFSPSTSTVAYTGSSAQTILPATYTVLSLSGVGQKNISGAVTATTLNANSTTISISGSLTTTTFNEGTSTVDFSASGDQSVLSGITYYNLIVSGSGNKSLTNTLAVTNNLTISGTAALLTGNNTVTVGGTITNGSTFSKTSGTLNVNGNFVNNATFSMSGGTLAFGGTTGDSEFSGTTAISATTVTVAKGGNSLTLSNTLNIEPIGTFTIGDASTTVLAGGNLVLNADASGYAYVPAIPTGSTITGSVTAEAYIPSTIRTWWQLTNPLTSVAASDWKDDFPITGTFTGASSVPGSNGASVYSYNETNTSTNMDIGWVKFPVSNISETMLPGVGYRTFIRDNSTTSTVKTLDVSGTLNQGNINIPLTYTESGNSASDGWNFIGNPYPATLDWTALAADGDLADNNAYVWDAITKNYSFSSTIQIAPFQAFWVQAANAGSLSLTESMKSSGAVLKRPSSIENNIEITLIDKNVDNSYNNSTTTLVINSLATSGFDKELEASYLSRNFLSTFGDEVLADIATKADGGKLLKRNYIPESESEQLVPLYIVFASSKQYSLKFSLSDFVYGGDLVLIDSYLNEEIVFSEDVTYDFSTDANAASTSNTRFKLKIGAKPVGLFGSYSENANVQIYPNPATSDLTIKVLSVYDDVEVSIIDMVGNEVYKERIANNSSSLSKTISTQGMNSGVYFVNVKHKGSVSTEKVIINKY